MAKAYAEYVARGLSYVDGKVAYNKAYYAVRRDWFLARRRDRYVLSQAIMDGERARGCVDCGEKDLRVLDFDHVRGTKRTDVTRLVMASANDIYAEIDKCEVRCANCHRRITSERLS